MPKNLQTEDIAAEQGITTIEDLDLPQAVLTRVIKSHLPDAQLQKDSKIGLARSGTVFISYLTATANDIAKQSNRKVISANDVLKALEMLEFEEILSEVKEDFEDYQKAANEKKMTKKISKANHSNVDLSEPIDEPAEFGVPLDDNSDMQ